MNSLRQHRIVVASLFLPTTIASGESTPSTPDHNIRHKPTLPSLSSGAATFVLNGVAKGQEPLRSIVEDLLNSRHVSKSASPATHTPLAENANPFSKFTSATLAAAAQVIADATEVHPTPTTLPSNSNSSSPPSSAVTRKYAYSRTTTGGSSSPQRVQRVRSTSRRPMGDLLRAPWQLEPNSHCNGGLKNALDSVADRLRRTLWVGTLGTNTDGFGDDLRRAIDRAMVEQRMSVPVWIPDSEFESCYDEFCHQVLWPCLHYAVPDAPKTKLFYESASFKQYVSVNQRFADVIAANYKEGDIIWVNDYHLMLLPSLLRRVLPAHSPIGFFMHVAFPSSEIFRCLSVREALLRGVLGADLVGFQTASYARHFRQTVSRILSLEALPKGILLEKGGGGRFVDVGVFPMGIDVRALKEKRQDPEVAEWVSILKQRYAGMYLVVGRDKLDTIQGVRQKIQAFEHFLDSNPEFQQKVVLIQVALQTTESNELAGGVADIVSHINSRFSTLTYQPVVFLHTQDLTFSQYLALLTVADAFLVTSLREGMALRTHEFVECQEGRHRPLILSEFTGSYSYSGFRSCIAINPWDTRGTAKAIHQALTMSDEEALIRWEELHSHVITQTAQTFVTTFLTRCLRANTEHHREDLSTIPEFDVRGLLPRYRHSRTRLLLLDFEGTLWQRDVTRVGLMQPFAPPEDVMQLLSRLVQDERNQVWLLSGMPVKGVMEQVAERIPNLGIVAENGCFIRTIPSRNVPAAWTNMVVNYNLTWKSACLEILHYFTERTPGSFIEEREASVVWRFWTGAASSQDCKDCQWARRQAAEAQNHIFDSLGERYGLRIVPGANSFLILPDNVSRSTAVGAILHPAGPLHSPLAGRGAAAWMMHEDENEAAGAEVGFGFVLVMGGDEKLLRRLKEINHAETCSTSGKSTDARWKLDAEKTSEVLWQFANVA